MPSEPDEHTEENRWPTTAFGDDARHLTPSPIRFEIPERPIKAQCRNRSESGIIGSRRHQCATELPNVDNQLVTGEVGVIDWLRKLMGGDQNAVPPGAIVERDDQDRITHVKQTLSLGEVDQAAHAYPLMGPVDGLAPRLAEACGWLTDQNRQLAFRHGIGLERNYEFDQEAGQLTLKFGRGRKIVATAQILASFDPHDRSLMWGWANPSVRPENWADAAQLKEEGERLRIAALTTPVQTVTFDTVTPLLAFGAQIAGADGLYRCMVNGSTSVFVTFRLDGHPDKSNAAAPVDDAALDSAHTLAVSYDAEMLPLDREYHERENEEDILAQLLERKKAVYRRYWSRNDDYWEPSSFGWPSDHDPDGVKLRFAVLHPEGGALDITIGDHVGETVYRIEPIDGALRITDILLNWGDGFIWPRAASATAS